MYLKKEKLFLLHSQLGHGPIQRISAPVIIFPAKEPASEGGWFEPLSDECDGSSSVTIGRVGLNISPGCKDASEDGKEENTREK